MFAVERKTDIERCCYTAFIQWWLTPHSLPLEKPKGPAVARKNQRPH